jgi:hypothetical protein
LADAYPNRATLADDLLPEVVGGFVVDGDAPELVALESRFTQDEWTSATAWTESFPDERVTALALEAVTCGLHGANAFVGNVEKAVDQEDRALSEEKMATIRANHMKEVEKGQTIGPTPSALHKSARILPQGAVKKDKYDEESERWRSTCDPSALPDGYEWGSINDLTCCRPICRRRRCGIH